MPKAKISFPPLEEGKEFSKYRFGRLVNRLI
jgi:hypothetical protein